MKKHKSAENDATFIIFKTADESSVSKKFLRTAADGKNYETKHYNLT